jgi:N-acetylglucosaminyl-diphospho-decaprenol L-rhamnosyltransferase
MADGEQNPSGPGTTIDVAIVSWNTREALEKCLESLRPASEAALAQVWVVDNASTDGSPDMVQEDFPWVRLIALKENLGYGTAINLAASRSSSPWLVISNADIVVRPGSLECLLKAGRRDDGAGIVAPRLILPNGSTQHSVWPFPSPFALAMGHLGPRLVPARLGNRLALAKMWDPTAARRVPWAIAAFLLVRREAWEAAGGFDPDQWLSAEDLELGWRMANAGWATRYEPGAVIDHQDSAAVGQRWGEHRAIHWQRCAYGWMVRRLGRSRTVVIGIVELIGSGTRLPLYIVCACRHPDPWRGKLKRQLKWTAVHAYAFAPRRVLARFR